MEKYIVHWNIKSLLYSAEILIEDPYKFKSTSMKPYTVVDDYQREFYDLNEAIEFYTDLKSTKKTTPSFSVGCMENILTGHSIENIRIETIKK